MTLYCKWFDTHNEYEAYKNGLDYILPNVSVCYQDHDVHYEKKYDPYNGYEYVDLGLPSGALWAKCNVGAETETDYGLYFAWGDTQGYTSDQVGTDKNFSWNDYKYGSYDLTDTTNHGMTKYNATDSKTVLDLEDDAARVNMGGEWRMPTFTEVQELLSLPINLETINGVSGIKFTGNNNNTLFIPFSGMIDTVSSVQFTGEIFSIWSSTLYVDNNFEAYNFNINDDLDIWDEGWNRERRRGGCVRGVIG